MAWTIHPHVGLNNFEIASNIQTVNFIDCFYKQQKSFFKFTRLSGTSPAHIYINGSEFTLYGAIGEIFYIELTSYVQATTGSATMLVQAESLATILSLPFTAIDGLARTKVVHDTMPSHIPVVNGSTLPFYIQFINACEWIKVGGATEAIGTNSVIDSFDIQSKINDTAYTNVIRLKSGTFSDTFSFTFPQGVEDIRETILHEIDCKKDIILVEWVGKFGELKSWWFEVTKTITEATKSLDMEALNDGFNILKNKQISVLLTTKQCDIFNQTYLSDLVISDNVSIYDGETISSKVQVKVSQNNFDVENKKKDISLIINVLRYDFI